MRRGFALLLAVTGVVVLGGCADAGSGDGPGQLVGGGTGTPEQTWQNMERALNEHAPAGWRDALGTTFEYVPDPVSAARFPGMLTAWGRADELAFAQTVFAATLEFHARLNVDDAPCPHPEGGAVVWPAVEYSLVVAGPEGESPVTYRGTADLEFRLDGSFWYLYRWVDLSGAAAPWNEDVVCPTLGELRAVYRGM